MTNSNSLSNIESEDNIENNDGEYWSFYQDYNFIEHPSTFTSWEDGDKGAYFKYVDNPTYGYWEDYYNDQEYDDYLRPGEYCIDINVYEYAAQKEYFTANNEGYWTVIAVPNDTIASDIGLKIDDKILIIREMGANVILQVRRGHKYLYFNIERKRIVPFYSGTI